MDHRHIVKRRQAKDIDRIEGNRIILNGLGKFPKRVVIVEPGRRKEYEIRKTSRGGYLFN